MSILLLLMSAYKAEKASGFTIDRAFSTRHCEICCGGFSAQNFYIFKITVTWMKIPGSFGPPRRNSNRNFHYT